MPTFFCLKDQRNRDGVRRKTRAREPAMLCLPVDYCAVQLRRHALSKSGENHSLCKQQHLIERCSVQYSSLMLLLTKVSKEMRSPVRRRGTRAEGPSAFFFLQWA